MTSKFDGDVRPLSNDRRYMHTVFSGTIDQAVDHAPATPDHGLTAQIVPRGMSRSRALLLQHLNLLDMSHGPPITSVPADCQRKPPIRAASPYSLEYAMSR